jgi:hypothetical protein
MSIDNNFINLITVCGDKATSLLSHLLDLDLIIYITI